jgi:hypothetical protein
MMTNARTPPAPIETSTVFSKSGSKSDASAGSATIPTAMLVAEMPT